MATGQLLVPPEIVACDETSLIFLNGPIQGAPDWQSSGASTIHSLDSAVTVASPRRDYAPGEFVYNAQVDWETHYRALGHTAGVNLFWLAKQVTPTPGRAYGQTSRFELGESTMQHVFTGAKLAVGIEEGFGNERYIRRRLSQLCADVIICDSLEETCKLAVDLLRN